MTPVVGSGRQGLPRAGAPGIVAAGISAHAGAPEDRLGEEPTPPMRQPAPTRRQILKHGAGAAGTAALPGRAADSVDAVVIGSGYAGSVAALRLAEAGIGSVVLERGRRWTIDPSGDTFAPQTRPDGRTS